MICFLFPSTLSFALSLVSCLNHSLPAVILFSASFKSLQFIQNPKGTYASRFPLRRNLSLQCCCIYNVLSYFGNPAFLYIFSSTSMVPRVDPTCAIVYEIVIFLMMLFMISIKCSLIYRVRTWNFNGLTLLQREV